VHCDHELCQTVSDPNQRRAKYIGQISPLGFARHRPSKRRALDLLRGFDLRAVERANHVRVGRGDVGADSRSVNATDRRCQNALFLREIFNSSPRDTLAFSHPRHQRQTLVDCSK
jgi:hypothetical protein